MTLSLFTLLFVATFVAFGFCYPDFANEVPNGHNVKHLLTRDSVLAVGHSDPQGGGERNCFGKDFDLAGKKWTHSLCQRDSDGDGRTNGEELSDPYCIWKKGDKDPVSHDPITHPGFCTPGTSRKCQEYNRVNSTCSFYESPKVAKKGDHSSGNGDYSHGDYQYSSYSKDKIQKITVNRATRLAGVLFPILIVLII